MKHIKIVISLCILSVALVGCAAIPVDDERGESVAQMIKSQTYDASASETTAGAVPLGQDAIAAQNRFNSLVRGTEITENSKRVLKSRVFRTGVSK